MKTTNRKTWLRRIVFAILMLSVCTMPVMPDDDEDDFDGVIALHQVVRDDRQRAHHKQTAEAEGFVSPSAPAKAAGATLLASLDAGLVDSFTPLPLAAHPLRP